MRRDKNFRWRRPQAGSLDLKGAKTAIVGGTDGIGRALSRLLASRGAAVLVIGRTFRDAGVPGIEFLKADLSLMREAERAAGVVPAEKLDLVIFTAGIFAAPRRQETSEGIERDMAVSYLSRLVMVRGMGPRLGQGRPAAAPKPRVFIMGFPGTGRLGRPDDLNAEKSYRAMGVHMNTVAGNEVLVLDAAARYPHANFFGLNPGIIKTGIRGNFLGTGTFRHRLTEWVIGLLTPSAEAYAERLAPLLVCPEIEGRTGTMFDRKGRALLASLELTTGYAREFMHASEALVSRTGVRMPT